MLKFHDFDDIFRLVCSMWPHKKKERVAGIGFQPGLDPAKVTVPHLDDIYICIYIYDFQGRGYFIP